MITTQRRLLNALGVVLILAMCTVVALLLQRSYERPWIEVACTAGRGHPSRASTARARALAAL